MLVSSNPAFLAYLGLPISHIRQNPKNANKLYYFLFSPISPIPPLGEPPIELSTQSPKYWVPRSIWERAFGVQGPLGKWKIIRPASSCGVHQTSRYFIT